MQALLACTERISCKINLIPFNPHPGSHFLPSHTQDVLDFRHAQFRLEALQRMQEPCGCGHACVPACALTAASSLVRRRSVIVQGGRVCTIRQSRGDDQLAACGQLGGVGDAQRRASLLPVPPAYAAAVAAAAV